jgi:tRNA(adenine34) deaminase
MAARIPRLVFGAWDEKAGACGSVWDLIREPRALHKVEVISGILERECQDLLLNFFENLRKT